MRWIISIKSLPLAFALSLLTFLSSAGTPALSAQTTADQSTRKTAKETAGAVGEVQRNLRRTHVVEVFEANRDAVVNVNTTTIVRQRFGMSENDPFFRRFFGSQPFERDVRRTSLGSGFIIHEAGYVVTNAHVVDGADQIDVTLSDGRELRARVLASDPRNDLAVLRVEGDDGQPVSLQRAELGDSSDLMIGEPVVAIGNPLGYEHSVTSGIVSALNRTLPVTREWKLDGLLQTDASINPGNSGGPLLNAYGQVIGINTAIRGDAQNIGFSIPVNRLRELIPELLSPLIHNQVDLGGRVVEDRAIQPPAELDVKLWWSAGGEQPLELTHINGEPVRDIVDAYVTLMRVAEVGEPVTLEGDGVIRQVFADRPKLDNAQRVVQSAMGVRARKLQPADRQRMNLEGVSGVKVTDIERGGPAQRGGLRVDDVIVQVGRHRVASIEDLALLLSQVAEGTQADIYIVREGRLGMTRITLRRPDYGST
ncbi:MAG: trypsin-like peptidase domain-containing protein [Phycisphaeraceae bacterium]